MAVRKEERSEGKLALSMLAKKHAVYVIQITSNEKIFNPKYSHAVTEGLVREAKDIFLYIWGANNVLVNSRETYAIRRQYQEKASAKCNMLLADIEIAHSLFHLSGKRVKYWTSMVVEIRNKNRAWTKSDATRYSEYL